MAFTAGTATNMADFCTKLYDFLTGDPATPGRDWTVLLRQATCNNAGVSLANGRFEWVLSNVGLSGDETVIIGVREWDYAGGAAWGLDFNCYTSWVPGNLLWNGNSPLHGRVAYDVTWRRFTEHPMLPLTNGSTAYWFMSNRQRVFILARANGKYYSAYIGFGNRLGSPSEYPYPLVASGNVNGENVNHASTSTNMRSACDPRLVNSAHGPMVYLPDGSCITAARTPWVSGLRFIPGSTAMLINQSVLMDPAPGNKVVTMPIYILVNSSVLMSLDGVDYAHIRSLSSEDIIIVAGKKNIAFQNVASSLAYEMYCADTGMTTTTTTTVP